MTYKNKFNSINMIPLIDVMLVLLVIVLTTATFISQGVIKIELPKAKTTANGDKKEDNQNIVIDRNGNIFFNKKKVSLKELENIIKIYEKNVIFTVKSDKEAKFNTFISVVDLLKSQKREKISIVTTKN
ncbi:MAG: TonB system transport protein ExbD [Campylobacterales bacterium]|nr:TonB system transport protein ExbD [Campylobacterales bacterium]